MTPNVDTRKLTLLKASETLNKKWLLFYSYRTVKNYHINHQFSLYDEFMCLDELKLFCDLHFPGVKLKVETFDEWWYYATIMVNKV